MVFFKSFVTLFMAAAVATSFASPVRRDGSMKSGKILFTSFEGITACGEDYTHGYQHSSEGVLLIGVTPETFGNGDICGSKISITAANGKTATGVVVDSCGDGCDENGLLVTPELFSKFYNTDKGEFQGQWQVLHNNELRRRSTVHKGRASYTSFSNGSITACGQKHYDSEAVVGVAGNVFGNGDVCGRQIQITAPNKVTKKATIVDTCGDGCGTDGLNLSPSLFQDFYALDKGIFSASWTYV